MQSQSKEHPLIEPPSETFTLVADNRKQWLLVWMGFAFMVMLIARASWLGDDAYIGFRAIDNFLSGYGPNFNVGERVQVYTYPLWFYLQVLFAYFSGGEYMLTMQVLSILVASIAIYVALRYLSKGPAGAFLILACLASSKAFMDYSSSGLENPLSFLLAGLFCHLAMNRGRTFAQWRWMVLVATLAVLTRQDMALIYFPVLGYRLWMHINRRETSLLHAIGAAVVFSLPLWLWLGFSLAYYGYPFPNTYYAKLYTGVRSIPLLFQGVLYFLSTLQRDGLTLLVIVAGIATAFLSRKIDRIMLAAGVVIYLLYVIKIGGDFMIGRFFSIPFFICLMLAVRFEMEDKLKLGLAAAAILIGLSVPRPSVLYGNDTDLPYDDIIDVRGIANERGFYYPFTSLVQRLGRAHGSPKMKWWDDGLEAKKAGKTYDEMISIGYFGVAVGPKMHIVDVAALADPLLAHLPVPFDEENPDSWRVGHYVRVLPDGYKESILSNSNQITDSVIRPVYDDVRLITRGPIWSGDRWKAIWRMNSGHYDARIKQWAGGNKLRWREKHPDDRWLNPF